MKHTIPVHFGLFLLAVIVGLSNAPAAGAVPASSRDDTQIAVTHDKDKTEKEDKKDKGEKSNNGKAKDKGKGKVIPLEAYSVAVACTPRSDRVETTCTFIADGPKGKGKVKVLYLPQANPCLEGARTDAEEVELEPGASLASRKNQPRIAVTLDGNVMVGGRATYWVEADKSLLPAVGPGLVCPAHEAELPEEPTPTATEKPAQGSIVVRVLTCSDDAGGETFDWYGECDNATLPYRFRLESESGGDGVTGATGDQGEIIFAGLDAGTYDLSLVDLNWCHAESDSVNDEGGLVVSAEVQVTVWIFICGM